MIDRETVERIKEAANIVDVVSEFVTLRKSGANYKGLCPFHNEKTPSFIVSPARGTCHCFGCGKGGNPVSFIMEHEQMTYPEALRWLANKYHIEIREREQTDEERQAQSERESMFIVNEWAAKYFQDTLHNNVDGLAVGMQYFRQRGFRDDIINKFQLGFSLTDRLAFARMALSKGYKEEFILKAGICYKNDRGELIDRYAGRVIFPWIGVSGKVVGFGGRLLDARTKGVQQKYVNSPESDIYHKDHELYGIYQAKRAIAKEDKVYMVEGYTDVISMHQCGIENVVANSGTALSVHQIHMLHRFTSNIVLLYDGDAAGIHAAMRGTDMLLSEGMNLKVLLFPDGDDPDSFARKHTASDFRKFIEENQTDFIQFKINLLLRGVTDPTKRAEAISSIVQSISMVENQILRDTYLHQSSQQIGVSEATLINEMNKIIRNRKQQNTSGATANGVQQTETTVSSNVMPTQQIANQNVQSSLTGVEKMLVQLILRQGDDVVVENVKDDEGNMHDLTLTQYVYYNLQADGLSLQNPVAERILQEAFDHSAEPNFSTVQYFSHHQDIEMSRLATSLIADKYEISLSDKTEVKLSEAEEKQMKQNARENLLRKVQHVLLDLRMAFVMKRYKEVKTQLMQTDDKSPQYVELVQEYMKMQTLRNELARLLGKEIIVGA